MKTVKYDERDGMPVEVATHLLLEPKARMSATMRKAAQRARQRTITSPSPIRRAADGAYDTDDKQVRREFSEKCKRKFAKLGAAKLVQMSRTTLKRRLAVQRPFITAETELAKMQADKGAEAVVKNARRYNFIVQLLQRLTDEANRLDTINDALQEEIEKRRLNINFTSSPER